MKSLLVHMATALLRAMYAALSLLPSRQRIVCISRQSNEEPADFALIRAYVEEHCPGWSVVVLARALNKPAAYLPHMLCQLYYLATSRAAVLDSYCIVVGLLAGHLHLPVVQLWHAMGNMKAFGYAALGEAEGRSAEEAKLLGMHRGYSSLVISSMDFAADYIAGFGCDASLLFESPLPRADLLLDQRAVAREQERIFVRWPELARADKKTIVYAPTFRREPAPNEAEAAQALIDAVDFDRYNLVYMAHPVSAQRLDDPRVIAPDRREFNLLCAADCVISDYSTVIYEAGLLHLPVYLYAYDWETYSERRSLNIDIEHDVPAVFTADARELMAAIEREEFDAEAFERFMAQNIAVPEHGSCTQRVVEHIFACMEDAGEQA